MIRSIRITIQYVMLILFIFILYKTSFPLYEKIPVDLFIRMDPLLALVSLSSGVSAVSLFIPALFILIISVFAGRIFCGWICPLGTMCDISGKFSRNKKTGPGIRSIKILLLIFILGASVAGLKVFAWLDPITILIRALADKNHIPYLLFLLLILSANMYQKRFWCRNLCPLGGLLGILSSRSLWGIDLGKSCRSCKRCEAVCPVDAIEIDRYHVIRKMECIMCYNCVSTCPSSGSSLSRGASFPGWPDISRREFLISFSAGLISAFSVNIKSRAVDSGSIIPPGSGSRKNLEKKCIRCGECIKVCVTKGLRFIGIKDGLASFQTPRLMPSLGQCEYNCNLCGRVCPTGAIKELVIGKKRSLKIGKAFIDRERCLVWSKGVNCLVCEEMCPIPTKAIDVDEITTEQAVLKRPVVIESKCIGCGTCENVCPAPGGKAIKIEGFFEQKYI